MKEDKRPQDALSDSPPPRHPSEEKGKQLASTMRYQSDILGERGFSNPAIGWSNFGRLTFFRLPESAQKKPQQNTNLKNGDISKVTGPIVDGRTCRSY